MKQVAAAIAGLPPRKVPRHRGQSRFSGLEPFVMAVVERWLQPNLSSEPQ